MHYIRHPFFLIQNKVRLYRTKKVVLLLAFLGGILLSFPLWSAATDAIPQPRIVGGQESNPGAWPWMAGLVKSSSTDDFNGQFCGGSLIGPDLVLTAAHCVTDGNEVDSPDSLLVILGRHDLTSNEGERIPVQSISVHPQYDSAMFNFDAALLRLQRSSVQQPIRITPGFSDLADPAILATVTGWGATNPGGTEFPANLQEVQVPILSNLDCANLFAQSGGNVDFLTSKTLCAGFAAGGKDSCQVDSGGPLVVPDGKGSWQQAGVVSFGFGCAQPGLPGVYSRTSEFMYNQDASGQFINGFISSGVCQGTVLNAPVLNVTVAETTVTANWSAVSGAEGYQIYYAVAPDGSPIGSFDIGNSTFGSAVLNPGDHLFLAVQAYTGNCTGAISDVVEFTI